MAFTYGLLQDKLSSTLSKDGKPVKVYSRQYLLKSDSVSNQGVEAAEVGFILLSGIARGEPFVDNPGAFCVSIQTTRRKSRPPKQAWDVDCEWTTDAPQIDDEDPSKRRWKRKVGTSEQQRYVFRDKNKKLIVDSAGSPFDGGVPVNVRLFTGVWEHNVLAANYDINRPATLSGKLNSDTFLGCEPGTLLLDVTAEEQEEGKWRFWRETLTLTYDLLGWQPKPANAGLYHINRTKPNSPKRERIKDANNKDAVEPEPLYADGTVVPFHKRPGDCGFIDVPYYPTMAFSELNIPTTA